MIKPLQRREHATRSERPVSNFYEYESVQSAINHGRQHSGGFQHPSGHPSFPPSRAEFSPVRSSGRRPQSRIYLPNEGFCFCFYLNIAAAFNMNTNHLNDGNESIYILSIYIYKVLISVCLFVCQINSRTPELISLKF